MPVSNRDRAESAMQAINAFRETDNYDGEDLETVIRDMITNSIHVLRLHCGLSMEDAIQEVMNALSMAIQETSEDSDN